MKVLFLITFLPLLGITSPDEIVCTPTMPSNIIHSSPGNGGADCPDMSFGAAVFPNGADYYEWSITKSDANGTITYTEVGTNVTLNIYVEEYPSLGSPDSYTQILKVRACDNSQLCGCSSYKVKYVEIENGC